MRPLLYPTLLSLAWLSGCVAQVDVNIDPDDDGLEDGEEAQFGTSPADADSDKDGYTDGQEVDGNTDPTVAGDHPYAGGWQIGACRDDIASTGDAEGEVANDFTMPDSYGDNVQLSSFCDRVVYMVFAAFW